MSVKVHEHSYLHNVRKKGRIQFYDDIKSQASIEIILVLVHLPLTICQLRIIRAYQNPSLSGISIVFPHE